MFDPINLSVIADAIHNGVIKSTETIDTIYKDFHILSSFDNIESVNIFDNLEDSGLEIERHSFEGCNIIINPYDDTFMYIVFDNNIVLYVDIFYM